MLPRLDQLAQQFAALLVGKADDVVTVDRQHIEGVEHHLRLVPLQRLEAGPAGRVEDHDLAVEHRCVGVDIAPDATELGIRGRCIEAAAALHAHALRTDVDEQQGAVAVPLDLVRPVQIVGLGWQ